MTIRTTRTPRRLLIMGVPCLAMLFQTVAWAFPLDNPRVVISPSFQNDHNQPPPFQITPQPQWIYPAPKPTLKWQDFVGWGLASMVAGVVVCRDGKISVILTAIIGGLIGGSGGVILSYYLSVWFPN